MNRLFVAPSARKVSYFEVKYSNDVIASGDYTPQIKKAVSRLFYPLHGSLSAKARIKADKTISEKTLAIDIKNADQAAELFGGLLISHFGKAENDYGFLGTGAFMALIACKQKTTYNLITDALFGSGVYLALAALVGIDTLSPGVLLAAINHAYAAARSPLRKLGSALYAGMCVSIAHGIAIQIAILTELENILIFKAMTTIGVFLVVEAIHLTMYGEASLKNAFKELESHINGGIESLERINLDGKN